MDTSVYVSTNMILLTALLVLAKKYVIVLPPCHHHYPHMSLYMSSLLPSCLQPFEASNYLSLYGVNEKCVNNLLSRYQEKLIPDLYR